MPLQRTGSLLVVEDHEAMRETLSDLLRAEGYQVSVAADGHEALDRLQYALPDALLLDLQMPRLSGWDVLRTLSAEPGWSGLPVIVISGVADGPQPASSQVRAWLVKPLRFEALLQVLGLVLPAPAAPGQSVTSGHLA